MGRILAHFVRVSSRGRPVRGASASRESEPMATKIDPSLRILIVDDEQVARAYLRFLLRGLGINDVTAADSGKAAMRLLMDASRPFPDLIITDLRMDDMDGLQFCNAIRRSEMLSNVGVPIIMLTAVEDSLLHEVPQQVGALYVAKKPITAGSLKGLILDHVGLPAEP